MTELNSTTPGTFIEGDSVRPWESLTEDKRELFCRVAEAYAASSKYTDVQIGHVIDYREESGQLNNTPIFYCADNGASGEGSPNGSVNENRFSNDYPDTGEENLAMLDKLDSSTTYHHHPTGWAVACSTPYRMFKRYSQYAGGPADPLMITGPKVSIQRRIWTGRYDRTAGNFSTPTSTARKRTTSPQESGQRL